MTSNAKRDRAITGPTLNVPGRWFRMMNPTEAVLLAYVNRRSSRPQSNRDKQGWFTCDARLIQNTLGIAINRQTRIISKLTERGFIETERRGQGARRWLRINWAALAKEMKK